MTEGIRRPTATAPRTGLKVMAAVVVTAVIVGVYQVVRTVNPIDWVVYRYGSAAAWRGVDIYESGLHGALIGQPDGMPFTYPPFAAVVLWPTNIGDLDVGFVSWTALSVLMVLALVALSVPAGVPRREVVTVLAWIAACATTVVSIHLSFGQVNLALAVMVLLDIGRSPTVVSRIPRGTLVGLAAAIKLTPLIFFVYLVLTRQWRALRVAIIAFVCAAGVGFAITPTSSASFWTDGLWHLDSTVALGTGLGSPSNSSLVGLAVTLGLPDAIQVTVVLTAALAGAYAAVGAFRLRGHFAGVVVMGLVGCLVSPVSWIHHWVYLLPAAVIIWCNGGTRSRLTVATATLLSVVTWPRTGERLLDDHSIWLAPIGWGIREMLVLMGLVSIAVLTRRPSEAHVASTEQVHSRVVPENVAGKP